MKNAPRILLLLFVTSFLNVRAQQPELKKVEHAGITDDMQLYHLPQTGTFITVQVMIQWPEYDNWDYFISTPLLIFGPGFMHADENYIYFSVGILKTLQSAYELESILDCGFSGGPFPVAYKDGKRIPLDEFTIGTYEEMKPTRHDVKERAEKLVNEGYYRVQLGYYEQRGLDADERKVYRKLARNGVEIIQEPYQNGRIYVTKEKFAGYREAEKRAQEIDNMLGTYFYNSHTILKGYGKRDLVNHPYVSEVNACLQEK